MKIRILPQNLINQIAAGEVVERPYSVIKELVENSIDAGASEISITIRDGGKSYISVIDNGNGMDKNDLQLCVERHATSKLPEHDLFNISTMGFRGEALPSIGSVARLRITSKRKGDEDHAWAVNVVGGDNKDIIPASWVAGTKIEVSDLFFATPARLKFLKAAQTETNYIIDVIKRLAMAYPAISFSLQNEKKTLFHYQCNSDKDDLYSRLADIIGKDFVDNSTVVNQSHDDIAIEGYAGLPTLNRSNAQQQYLFVNGRSVKDKLLNHAVKIAYSDFVARDRYPIVVLYLSIDPLLVDVNVHPAKTEVRFRDPGKVRSSLISALSGALRKSGFKASSTVAEHALSVMQPEHTQPKLTIGHQRTGNIGGDYLGSNDRQYSRVMPYHHSAVVRNELQESHVSPNNSSPDWAAQDNTEQDDFSAYPLGFARTQLHNTYIVAESSDSIVIVDQHAVHERLIYEKMKLDLQNSEIKTQCLLVPEIVKLDAKHLDKILAYQSELSKFGIIIEGFGDDAIIVRELPSIIGEIDINKLVLDIAEEIAEMDTSIVVQNHINDILGTMACHGSIRAGRKLSIQEMNEMLRQMESTPYSGQCNHGRPTYVKLEKKDIEKLFGRR